MFSFLFKHIWFAIYWPYTVHLHLYNALLNPIMTESISPFQIIVIVCKAKTHVTMH